MKSLMEEASSVGKAIEAGWEHAGKPSEFTVKVYEEAEKNFLGFTSKPAKVGIFFKEGASQKEAQRKPRQERQKKQQPAAAQKSVKRESKPEKQEDLGPIWSDDMVSSTKSWLATILKHMGKEGATFSTEPSRFHLKINFHDTVLDDQERQKHLFAVLSNLLLTMLKRQCKRPLRGYKLVLTQE